MLEDYIDAVYAALDDNKVALGLVEVHEEDLFEQINIREADQLPIALVDGPSNLYTKETPNYPEMVVTILLLFDLGEGNYTPASYKAARATARAMERDIYETYLRHIAGFEEPESVLAEGSMILIGNRKVYGLFMTVTNISPVTLTI